MFQDLLIPMTTITINEDIHLSSDNFDNSNELMEELAEANGFKVAWALPDDELTEEDHQLIVTSKAAIWESLDNL